MPPAGAGLITQGFYKHAAPLELPDHPHLTTQRCGHAMVGADFPRDGQFSVWVGEPLLFNGCTSRDEAGDAFVVTVVTGFRWRVTPTVKRPTQRRSAEAFVFETPKNAVKVAEVTASALNA
jgi:hypothetical protein